MKPILFALAAAGPLLAMPVYAQNYVTLPNGSEGIPQSANSLPPGFLVGTPGYNYAQSVARSFAAEAAKRALQEETAKAMKPVHPAGSPAS